MSLVTLYFGVVVSLGIFIVIVGMKSSSVKAKQIVEVEL
jgi:hypothetical protein